MERARERARESGRAGDSAEVGEALVLPGVERGACGDGFGADERCRRDSPSGQDRRREPRGELREAEAMQPGRCSARHRHSPRQVVGRAAGGRHDERPAIDPRRQPTLASRRRADASELSMMWREPTEGMTSTSPDAVPGHRYGRATRP